VTVKDGNSKMVARPKGKYADVRIIGVEAVEQKNATISEGSRGGMPDRLACGE
jgi:hypothetical protein